MVNDDGLLRAVLAHWRIVDVATAEALHYKGTVVLVTTSGGDRVVLAVPASGRRRGFIPGSDLGLSLAAVAAGCTSPL